jgi:hypothetical protein
LRTKLGFVDGIALRIGSLNEPTVHFYENERGESSASLLGRRPAR